MGERVEIPEFMANGSSYITRMSHDLWAKSYHELAAKLGDPDMASSVKAAVTKQDGMDWPAKEDGSPSAEVLDPNSPTRETEEQKDHSGRHDWSRAGSWWADEPSSTTLANSGV